MQTTTKIIRLKSGEDIIADFFEDGERNKFILYRPMHVLFKRMLFGKIAMLMLPWLPVELLKKNFAEICASDVTAILDPKDDLIDYYKNMADEAEDGMSGELNLNFQDANEDEDEEDGNDVEINEEQLEELIKEKKNNLLH